MKSAVWVLCFAALAAAAQTRVGEVTTDNSGETALKTVATGGAIVMSGSAVSASGKPATFRLDRGGSVHICPRTTVTASTSPSGRELMLALDSGTLELDYPLAASADSVLTPDLRMSLSGPATVHVAVDVLRSGDVCVASLDRNTADVTVSELAGEGSYQVRPGQQITFAKGAVANAHSAAGMNCGCPVPAPIRRASVETPASPPATVPAQTAPAAPATATDKLIAELPASAAPQPTQPAPETTAVPTHTVVEMDAPMIYSGERPEPPNETLAQVRLFRSADDVLLFPPLALPAPPPAEPVVRAASSASTAQAAPAKPQRGIFHRVGSFFASLFRSSPPKT
jgi:hypothetical protein